MRIMNGAYVPIDSISFPHASLHLLERIHYVPIEVVEVADPILVEEWPRHRTMEFPQFA